MSIWGKIRRERCPYHGVVSLDPNNPINPGPLIDRIICVREYKKGSLFLVEAIDQRQLRGGGRALRLVLGDGYQCLQALLKPGLHWMVDQGRIFEGCYVRLEEVEVAKTGMLYSVVSALYVVGWNTRYIEEIGAAMPVTESADESEGEGSVEGTEKDAFKRTGGDDGDQDVGGLEVAAKSPGQEGFQVGGWGEEDLKMIEESLAQREEMAIPRSPDTNTKPSPANSPSSSLPPSPSPAPPPAAQRREKSPLGALSSVPSSPLPPPSSAQSRSSSPTRVAKATPSTPSKMSHAFRPSPRSTPGSFVSPFKRPPPRTPIEDIDGDGGCCNSPERSESPTRALTNRRMATPPIPHPEIVQKPATAASSNPASASKPAAKPWVATDPTQPLKLTQLKSIPHLPYKQNWMCNVLAVIASLSEVEPSTLPPFKGKQRTARLADASTTKRVILTVFLDAEEFTPEVGSVVLLMGVKNHRFDGGCLKKYESDRPTSGMSWWAEDPGTLQWCGEEVAGLRAWWAEQGTGQ
ncbi:hypothetical protein OQA88_12722 [Cercophora sp. LCS_1]